MQRDNGLMRGKGGSMHLTSSDHGVMGSYAIIGAHLPIACGAAWRAQYKGQSDVSVCFFGDGTTNIGAFHEALNFAAVWKLPVIFVCENNLYMEYTPIGDVTAVRASRRRPRRVLRTAAHRRRRQRRRRCLSRRARGLRQGARRRRAVFDRVHDLSLQRPFARRSGQIPARGRAGKMEGARSDQNLSRTAQAIRRRRGHHRRDRDRRETPRRRSDREMQGSADAAGRTSSPPTFMPTEASHGGIDLSRRRHPRHRPGNVARSRRGVSRRGRGQGRRRVQGDRRSLRAVRPAARARHADFRAGDPRRRHGRGDDRIEADRRNHVFGLLRRLLRLHRQRVSQKPLHVERPAQMSAGGAHRQRRRLALRRAAFAERRELVHDDSRSESRGAVVAARRHRAPRCRGARSGSGDLSRAQIALPDQGRGAGRRNRRHDSAPPASCGPARTRPSWRWR